MLGGSRPPAHSETDAAAFIKSALTDVLGRERFAGRHTLVVDAGDSAANTLLPLSQLATRRPARG
ncbi:hypothetical protein [Catellatospora citrea]|uniref:Uncharacterized protein n=1 Tax=Catellatospora citrea TaxID=53366 RepID=A0A8J3P3V9_9ACTN|nr:hypothetical protein [Catellatospora citrea]GIG03046.1 hypothetical protein Cci01nite_81390 [Catellatospora citrea]